MRTTERAERINNERKHGGQEGAWVKAHTAGERGQQARKRDSQRGLHGERGGRPLETHPPNVVGAPIRAGSCRQWRGMATAQWVALPPEHARRPSSRSVSQRQPTSRPPASLRTQPADRLAPSTQLEVVALHVPAPLGSRRLSVIIEVSVQFFLSSSVFCFSLSLSPLLTCLFVFSLSLSLFLSLHLALSLSVSLTLSLASCM